MIEKRNLAQRQFDTERYILSTFPVLYLPLWKRDGASFISDDGIGHICTVTGALWTPQGRSFDGNDDYIEITPAPALLNFTTEAFTIMVWCYPLSVGDSSLTDKGLTNTDGYKFKLTTTGRFDFYTYQAGVQQRTYSSVSIAINVWQHLAVTRSGAVCNLYRNAVLDVASAGTHLDPLTSSRTFKVGIFDDLTGDFPGKMGEVYVCNRALSATEIMNIYLATKFRYQ